MGFFSSFGLLAPLYVAAGLAVGLPILFHLIRRTPQGRQDFSSVMFLSPSPPRITRRSRIENWLLLLLRALAVLLIVAAFCRPLWRQLLTRPHDGRGREIVLLLDTSASLQRAGLWDEARRIVTEQLTSLTPADQFTLLAFDDRVRPILEREEWVALDPAQRVAVATARLNELQPGWGATHLDTALREAADRLEQSDAGRDPVGERIVWVVSDLASGSRWQGLQGWEWPRGVDVELLRLAEHVSPTNAGIRLVGAPETGTPPIVRVRVTNSAASTREQFQLGWRGAFDDPQTTGPTSGVVNVYVPPGQSRVVGLPHTGEDLDAVRVALTGDDHPFDNACSVTWPRRQRDRIVYLGPDPATDRNGLRFFLPPLFTATDEREVEILDRFPVPREGVSDDAAVGGRATTPVSLVIATGRIDADTLQQLQAWLRGGGVLLYVIRDVETAGTLFELAGVAAQPITEAATVDYAMLRDVDFHHPLFQVLNDPRYSDLSKVHFWRHRVVADDAFPEARVLARFDDGAAALLESPVDAGRLLVITSGWNRSDSELATWSKFIPIMHGVLESARPRTGRVTQLTVGDAFPVEILADLPVPPRTLTLPDGKSVEWSTVNAADVVREPGLYRIFGAPTAADADDAVPQPLATFTAAIAADESRTAPLGSDVFDAVGIAVEGDEVDVETQQLRQAQLASSELESRQKLWRWLLGGALAVLFLETIIAARPQRAPVVDAVDSSAAPVG